MLKFEEKVITPEIAKEWIDNGLRNRSVKTESLKKFKNDMLANRFHSSNGEPLIISNKGRLMDGRHRLMAIVATNKTIKFGVISGVDEKLMVTIDTGKERTLGDVFQIGAVRNGNIVAKASKLLCSYTLRAKEITESGIKSHNLIDNRQVIYDFYMENMEEIDGAVDRYRKYNEIIRTTGSGVLAFVFLVLRRIDEPKCYEFMESYESGCIKKSWKVVAHVRDSILNPGKVRIREYERISFLFGAWNCIYNDMPENELGEKSFHLPLGAKNGSN